MTTETLSRVMRGYEAFNRGDFDEAVKGFHPEVEWLGPDLFPESQSYRGVEGVRSFWSLWQEVFEDFRIEVDEAIEAGDQVIVMARVAGRGRDSGAEVITPVSAHVWTIRDGLFVRMEMLPSKEEALAAVGLSKQDG